MLSLANNMTNTSESTVRYNLQLSNWQKPKMFIYFVGELLRKEHRHLIVWSINWYSPTHGCDTCENV